MKFYGVLSKDLDFVWDKVKPELEKSLTRNYNRVSLQTIYKNILNKDHQLWIADEGCFCIFVTEIVIFDNCKQLRINYCGGSFGDTTKEDRNLVFQTLKMFGKSHGCNELIIPGRDGWGKICPELIKDHIVYRLEL